MDSCPAHSCSVVLFTVYFLALYNNNILPAIWVAILSMFITFFVVYQGALARNCNNHSSR